MNTILQINVSWQNMIEVLISEIVGSPIHLKKKTQNLSNYS